MARTESVTDLDAEGLARELVEAKQALFNLRFQNATGQLDNTAELGRTRRHIARITTELRAREIAAAEELEAQSKEHADG